MRCARLSTGIALLAILTACSNTRFVEDCLPKVGSERERCMSHNESSEKAVQDRAKAKRSDKASPGEFDQADLKATRDK